MNTQLLLLYTWVLIDFACEYIIIAAIHMGLRDFACEYTVVAAIHMGFKRFCL